MSRLVIKVHGVAMNKVKKILFVIILLAVLTVIGVVIMALGASNISKEEDDIADNKLTVVTSFYPMYIAAMNITEDIDINLYNLSEPKTGCLHDYQLTSADMKLLSKADVFIINGGGMEEFLEEVVSQYPNLTIIDACNGIELYNDNSHVWMSVSNHIKQVENIAGGLSDKDVNNSDRYNFNAIAYIEKLNSLKTLEDESLRGVNVVLFSEAYEYLAKDFDLNVKDILDLDEEKDISARELANTIDVINNEKVPLIIAEEEYGKKMAESVMKETDVKTIYLDTIIRGSYDRDSYIDKMRTNITLLKTAV